jgi:O-antigen ligase
VSSASRGPRVTPPVRRESVVRSRGAAGAKSVPEGLGVQFLLLLVWIWFEYGRPEHPLGIPLLISTVLIVGWILNKDKRWGAQGTLLVAFLSVMALGIPLAANNFAAFWALYSMATVLVCICLPLPSLVTSVRKVRVWIYTFVAVALYVGLWAVSHGGYGPAGGGGGQDENYVAAMMGMAVSFAYFSIFAAKGRFTKLVLAGSIPVFLGATIAGQNVSRGGFLGLCAVCLYCLTRSRRKLVGIVVIGLILAVVLPFAGEQYWDEISSIRDVHEGTADMRLEIWQIGIRMWQAHPILGAGAGNFRWMVGVYQSPEQLAKYGRDLGGSIITHSLFVELLAELGLAGALVFLALLWRTVKDLGRVLRDSSWRKGICTAVGDELALRCYADAVMGAILACLVNGIFLSLLYYSYLWLFMMLGSAIWQISRSPVKTPRAA